MRRVIIGMTVLVLFAGCASYKELQPDPLISPDESGFRHVYDGDKVFIVREEEKLFIRFPSPPADKFALILKTPPKSAVSSLLTRDFDAVGGSLQPITDETLGNDTLSVYPIDLWTSNYAWVVTDVRREMPLMLQYRYAPRWRYVFETRSASFKDSLAGSRADRTTFEAIRPGFNVDEISLKLEVGQLGGPHDRARSLRNELDHLKGLFPDDIAGSKDTAYLEYLELTRNLEEEIEFHEAFFALLEFLQIERANRGKPEQFLSDAPRMTAFMQLKDRYPARIRESMKQLILPRIAETTEYFGGFLKTKNDLDLILSLDPLVDLVKACEMDLPADLSRFIRFVSRFNAGASAVGTFQGEADRIESESTWNRWPGDSLYSSLLRRVKDATEGLPDPKTLGMETEKNFPSAVLLDRSTRAAHARAAALQHMYLQAEGAALAIRRNDWSKAESGLKAIWEQRDSDDSGALVKQRNTILRLGEEEIHDRVLERSRLRAESYINSNALTVRDIPALYGDSAFTPIYTSRFSMGGVDLVSRRREGIRRQMNSLRDVTFPETAVTSLYRALQKADESTAAQFGLAIVEHGKLYKGEDAQVKGLVNEFNAAVPKTISRAKEYRKVFALPVRKSGRGHEYLVRLRLRIPSDAKFPVYDVSIKLPEVVASGGRNERWYQSITINNKPIKNEGRFRITAPLRANNFESLISPVQTDKQGNNILELRFVHPEPRLFEISAMAQVPIIRKH